MGFTGATIVVSVMVISGLAFVLSVISVLGGNYLRPEFFIAVTITFATSLVLLILLRPWWKKEWEKERIKEEVMRASEHPRVKEPNVHEANKCTICNKHSIFHWYHIRRVHKLKNVKIADC